MIRLATRQSPLALRQAAIAAERITAMSGERVEILPFSSLGDEDQVRPLARFLRPGAFTGRLDEALQMGEADVAVHSLKDVPLRPPAGLTRTYVLQRADPADRLVTALDAPLGLAAARVGTSAPRRQSQLEAHHPDAIAVDVRGSIGTRLQRIDDGELDALFVAAAALERGQDPLPDDAEARRLPLDSWPTAPGQGALALQAREGRAAHRIIESIEDTAAARAVAAERGLLADLGGGCGTPLGATCLPPGHPEGDASNWTLHVTFPSTMPLQPLARFTFHDQDPDHCRRRAVEALHTQPSQSGKDSPTPRGRVLLVTDPDSGTSWRETLRSAGYAALHWWPFTTTDLTHDDAAVRQGLAASFSTTDWVLVTSPRAVAVCARLHEETGALPRFAAVGPATARALRAAQLPVTLVPSAAQGEEVARLLERRAARDDARKVLWVSGAHVTPETEDALRSAELDFTRIPVYRVDPVTPPPLPQGPFDAVLFTSARTARHTVQHLSDALDARQIVAIGPSTAAALHRSGIASTALSAPTPSAFLHLLLER